jgi:hypothetical protein
MATRRLAGVVGTLSPPLTPRSDNAGSVEDVISGLADLDAKGLRLQWRNHLGGTAPAHLPRCLLLRVSAYPFQVASLGGPDKATSSANRNVEPSAVRLKPALHRRGRGPILKRARNWSASGRASWKEYGPRKGLCLEWQVLFQPFPDCQGDDRHSLERPPLLRLANGDIGALSASGPRDRDRGDGQARCRVGRTCSKQTGRLSLLFTKRCGRIAAGSAATLDHGRRRNAAGAA